ncbi:MAG: ATP-binding protein [Granulosicoccus sp.]|nr:ATP-binding protein [Granulosicoccus sp.]
MSASERKPVLIAMAGLPASGKSALARELHKVIGGVLLDKDQVRKFLFQAHVDYSRQQNDLCVDIMFSAAAYLLAKPAPPPVIVDGRTFSRRYQIEALKNMANGLPCRLAIVECICSEKTAEARLRSDSDKHPAKDRDYAMYQASKAAAELIEEPTCVVDTDNQTLAQCVDQVLAYLEV